MSILLLLKLTVTPLLVAGMSLVARRFGSAVGGLIMGLPWMTGPVLFFLAVEHGDGYLVEASRGALLAVPLFGLFGLVYTTVARWSGWPLSLASAAIAFAIAGWFISAVAAPPTIIAMAGIATLLAAHAAIPRPAASAALRLPWWDIPARMGATAAVVGAIALTSDVLGPTLSGIASSYPVILTVVGVFTHAQGGRHAITALVRSLMLSLIGFTAFFWLVAELAPLWGRELAYIAATIGGLSYNSSLLMFNRWRAKAAPSTPA